MEEECDSRVEAIQSSGYKAGFVMTGGGSGVIHQLLAHPGASRFVSEVQIPYSAEALANYLGEVPGQSCSEVVARRMAQRAFERASAMHGSSAIGIACTAALQTRRERKGTDRAHICFRTAKKILVKKLEIASGTRVSQEADLSRFVLEQLADFIAKEAQ